MQMFISFPIPYKSAKESNPSHMCMRCMLLLLLQCAANCVRRQQIMGLWIFEIDGESLQRHLIMFYLPSIEGSVPLFR